MIFWLSLLALAAVVAYFGYSRWRAYNKRAMEYWRREMSSPESKRKTEEIYKRYQEKITAQIDQLIEKSGGVERFAASLPDEIDLVCAGGGYKVSFAAGVFIGAMILHEKTGKMKPVRRAGASAGGQVLTAFRTEESMVSCNHWALSTAQALLKFPYMHPAPLWKEFYPKLANDLSVPEKGTLNISVAELKFQLSWPPVKFIGHVVNEFSSTEDVGDALLTTGAIPFLLCHGPWFRFRGVPHLDGGFTNNVPYFQDNQRAQLVVRYEGFPSHLSTKIIYFTEEEIFSLWDLGVSDFMALIEKVKEGNVDYSASPSTVKNLPKWKRNHRLELIPANVKAPVGRGILDALAKLLKLA